MAVTNERGRPAKGSPIPNTVPWQDNSESKPSLPAIQACNTAELQINKRERFKTERDQRHGKSVVRIVRLKPSADGGERAVACLEFADRHLSGVIAMLQELQELQASADGGGA
jgi:hypothetical protein